MADSTDSKPLPNIPTPPSVKVERQPAEFPGSDNKAGGEVPAAKYQSR